MDPVSSLTCRILKTQLTEADTRVLVTGAGRWGNAEKLVKGYNFQFEDEQSSEVLGSNVQRVDSS